MPSETATAEPERSDRGFVVKVPGDTFRLIEASGAVGFEGRVTGITVDPVCTGAYALAPENGHFVRVDLEIETFPEFEGQFITLSDSWKVISADGTTFNGNPNSGPAYSCLTDAERAPTALGPSEKVVGSVIFDVGSPSGVLAKPYGAGGWEWAY